MPPQKYGYTSHDVMLGFFGGLTVGIAICTVSLLLALGVF